MILYDNPLRKGTSTWKTIGLTLTPTVKTELHTAPQFWRAATGAIDPLRVTTTVWSVKLPQELYVLLM